MSLSKPFINLLGSYFEQLYMHPVRTKSITSGVIATLGNLTAQHLYGTKPIKKESAIAFGLFGLLFSGPINHYFYTFLESIFPPGTKFAPLKKLLLERLIYAPIFIGFSLYMLSRLEGKTHVKTTAEVQQLYLSVLKQNWKYLTVIQYLNLRVIPPMLRVFVLNLVGFYWCIHLAKKRSQAQERKQKAS